MKQIELTDEILTSYALGELDGAEAAAVSRALDEATVNGDTKPMEALEEIRATVALSEAAFAAQAAEDGMTDDQQVEVTTSAWRRSGRSRAVTRIGSWTAVAAALLISTAIALPALFPAREAARRASPENTLKQIALTQELQAQDPSYRNEGAEQIRQLSREYEQMTGEPVPDEYAVPAITLADSERDQLEALGYLGDGGQATTRSSARPNVQLDFYPAADSRSEATSDTVSRREQLIFKQELLRQERRLAGLQAPGNTSADRQQVAAASPQWRYQPAPRPIVPPGPQTTPGTEAYPQFADNAFKLVRNAPLSTFSIDVDTASYANVRRFLNQGQLPPRDAVRVEELINYFDYRYAPPSDDTPFAASMEVGRAPWTPQHKLVRIGLKGREIPASQRPATNLVFLIDVSGSMQASNKLPLVQRGMTMLTNQLDARDRVAIVTYASGTSVPLQSTSAMRKDVILGAIDSLRAGGSTNGAGGIRQAYQIARANYIQDGVNRVILATDGDFNVGVTDNRQLEQLITREAQSGVFLSVLGFGMGNIKDDRLEMLSNKGNGNYAYIDSVAEAKKVFLDDLSGTLVTIAKDVKIQVEFNPAKVAAYRLIGYENRALANRDFADDKKDAGEIGAGHTVTALYELVPAGVQMPGPRAEQLRYQQQPEQPEATPEPASIAPPEVADELLLLKLRYKEPDGQRSSLLEFPLPDSASTKRPSDDFRFASAVGAFGYLLRGNALGQGLTYDGLIELAESGTQRGDDPRRNEFVQLLRSARHLIDGIPGDAVQPNPMLSQPVNPGIGLKLLRIQEVAPGDIRAQIQHPNGATRWYSEGEGFSGYELISIDPAAGTVIVFSERHQQTFVVTIQ